MLNENFFSFSARRALRVCFAVTELKRLRGEESLGRIASCFMTIVLLQPRFTSPIPSCCHRLNGTASDGTCAPEKFHHSSTKLFRNCYYSNFIRKHTLRFISLKLIKLKSCNFAQLCRRALSSGCQRRVKENDCRDTNILLAAFEGRQ